MECSSSNIKSLKSNYQNNLPRLCDRRNRFQLIVRSPRNFFFVPCSAEPVDRVDIEHLDVIAGVTGVEDIGCNQKKSFYSLSSNREIDELTFMKFRSIGVMTLSSRQDFADKINFTSCCCVNHLTSMPDISTMKSPSFRPPN